MLRSPLLTTSLLQHAPEAAAGPMLRALAILSFAVAVCWAVDSTAAERHRAVRAPVEPRQQSFEVDYTYDVVYATVGTQTLLADLIRPRTSEILPAVVVLHGGGFRVGARDGPLSTAEPVARRGYVIASIDYRLLPAQFPAQIEDGKAAVRFLRAHAADYNIDPNQIAAWGISAGGTIANLMGTAGDVDEWNHSGGSEGFSSRVAAVVDWFGTSDLVANNGGCGDLTPLIGCPFRNAPTSGERQARSNT